MFLRYFQIFRMFFSSKNLNFFKKLALLILLFTVPCALQAVDKGEVRGRLTDATGKALAEIPVALLRFDPSVTSGPPMSPIGRTSTDQEGNYSFKDIEPEEGISYIVGILVNGNRLSSERFDFTEENPKTVDFSLTETAAPAAPASPPAPAPKAIIGTGSVIGKITVPAGKSPDNVPVALLRLDPEIKEGPPMSPIGRTATDADGNYKFADIQIEKDILYIVGILFEKERLSSEAFDFSIENPKRVDFTIAESISDATKLIFLRNSLVLNYSVDGHKMIVTAFYNFLNAAHPLKLDLRENPITIALPEGTTDPVFFPNDGDNSVINFTEREARLGLVAPGETGQVIFEYAIPVPAFPPFDLEIPMPPTLTEFEIFYPLDAVEAEIGDLSIIPTPQFFGKKEYNIKTVKGLKNPKTMTVKISSLPNRQENIAIFVGVISAVFIFGGLIFIFFRLRKARA